MAQLVATADGNFTDATTGAVCDAASVLDSDSASTALTTGDQNSQAFTPAAVAIDAILVKIASRAVGIPTNTISITLRNATTAADIATVTINVSDIEPCDSVHDGGWYCFKLAATHTPNGTDTYVIRARLSSTSTAVNLYRDATALNWNRLLRTTTTQAPAATDRMVITREWTAAATGTNRTVTMNNTAATVFGHATGLNVNTWMCAALCVGKGGTLVGENAAATAYQLRLTGSLVVFRGGVINFGHTGTEMPRDSSLFIEFVPTTSFDSRVGVLNGTFKAHGLSRTSGKDIVWCLLNTDEAAAQTVLGVDTDTGWLSGDEIGVAATARSNADYEERILSGAAGASSMTVTAGLTNAHKGSVADGLQAEVVLLTRNIVITTNHATRYAKIQIKAAAVVDLSWIEMRRLSQSGFDILTLTASGGICLVDRCSFRIWDNTLINVSSGATFTITNNIFAGNTSSGQAISCNTIPMNFSFTGNVIVRTWNTACSFSNITGGDLRNNRIVGALNTALSLSASQPGDLWISLQLDGLVIHSCGGGLSWTNGLAIGLIFTGWQIWRNGAVGWAPACNAIDCELRDSAIFGNLNENVSAFSATVTMHGSRPGGYGWLFRNCIIAGETGFATGQGFSVSGAPAASRYFGFHNCILGGGGGTKIGHTNGDIYLAGSGVGYIGITLNDCSLLSTTEIFISGAVNPYGSFIRQSKMEGDVTRYSYRQLPQGTIAYETGTVHAPETVSEKLSPGSATYPLKSSMVRVAVNNGDTVTLSAWVRKDATYAGAAPSLILMANPAIGIDADVVLDTLSVAADTWEQLSGTTAAVTGNGVLEFYVQVIGTVGAVYLGAYEAA